MKILHICLSGPYTENWTYQENILPKYQSISGNDVYIIATTYRHLQNGDIVDVGEIKKDIDYNIHLQRMKYKKNIFSEKINMFRKYSILTKIEEIKPDFIMMHGIGNISCLQLKKYKKFNKKCKIIADNHIYVEMHDLKKNLFIKKIRDIYITILNKIMKNTYDKIYCISPACYSTAKKYWHIDKSKLDLLPLGFDDEMLDSVIQNVDKSEIREKNNIDVDKIIIITGGKIDYSKNIHILAKSILHSKQNVVLIIFGNFVNPEVQEEIMKYVDSKKIIYVGFLQPFDIYKYLYSSDIAFFPGTQSVLWQQSIACGLPCVFKYWKGIEYLDLGGNCVFIHNIDENTINESLSFIANSKNITKMSEIAKIEGKKAFSYRIEAEKIL